MAGARARSEEPRSRHSSNPAPGVHPASSAGADADADALPSAPRPQHRSLQTARRWPLGPAAPNQHAIRLQAVVAEVVTAAPQIHVKDTIEALAPALDDERSILFEARGPVPHRQLVVAALVVHLQDVHALVVELGDEIVQRQI